MANQMSTRQWKLDTPLAFGTSAAILWRGNIKVVQMEWSGFAASGQLIIKDSTGNIVWQSNISATDTILEPVRLSRVGWINGFVLDTLSGGTVMVYLD